MSRLIAALVRHGDYHQLPGAPSAHQPFALNERGEDQAREAGEVLAQILLRESWDLDSVIDSSRMLRAWQTASLIAERVGRPEVRSFDALAERGVGCAANLTVEQIERALADDPRYPPPPAGWKADSHYCLPLQGAESLLQAGERVAGHLRSSMAALRGGEPRAATLKVYVGHGAAFRHAAYHLGVLAFDDIARLSMYHGVPVLLEYLPDGSWRQVGGQWKQRAPKEEFVD
jgi:broad specificity phosphatase PhoE